MSKLSWLDERGAKTLAEEYDFSGGQIDNIVRKVAMDEIREMCRSEKLNLQGVGNKIGFGACRKMAWFTYSPRAHPLLPPA